MVTCDAAELPSLTAGVLIDWMRDTFATLVFAATDGAVRRVALKSRGRPTPRTPRYHAPWWNVSENGRACLGV
jgi:hypothetical protein